MARSSTRSRSPAAEAERLQRAKRAKQTAWLRDVLAVADFILSEADRAAAIGRVMIHENPFEAGKYIDRAQRRIYAARMMLRAHLYDEHD